MSWYEVALKLRLPEMISQNSADVSVLENVVGALIHESSVKTRRQPEVVIEGIIASPKPLSLPSLTIVTNPQIDQETTDSTKKQKPRRPKSSGGYGNSTTLSSTIGKPSNPLPPPPIIIKRPVDPKSQKSSVENWIPEVQRMRSLHRDLIILKENVNDIVMRDISVKRETKQLLRSDLQKAEDEMSLEMTKKVPCGCCLQPFLYVNLPLKVSQKAIVDIRVKWSGGLNSSTIFQGIQSLDPDLNPFFTSHLNNPNGGTSGLTSTGSSASSVVSGSSLSSNGRLREEYSNRRVPLSRIYEEVRVCIFCAQFFQDQESYRPSFLQIVHEEKKAAYFDARRRELEYWDPLKMCEKDRERAAMLQAQSEAEAAALRAERANLDDEHHDGSITDGNGGGLD